MNLVLTHGVPLDVHGGVHIFLPEPHTIGSVPSISGRAIAYRWRSLLRVRWHRAVVLEVVRGTGAAFSSPWTKCYCAPLFSHTHHWYKVSMFKLSGVYQNISTAVLLYCFVEPFFLPNFGLYKCKESSVQCTRYNIIRSVPKHYLVCNTAVLWTRFLPPRLISVLYKCKEFSVHGSK